MAPVGGRQCSNDSAPGVPQHSLPRCVAAVIAYSRRCDISLTC